MKTGSCFVQHVLPIGKIDMCAYGWVSQTKTKPYKVLTEQEQLYLVRIMSLKSSPGGQSFNLRTIGDPSSARNLSANIFSMRYWTGRDFKSMSTL